MSVGIYNVTPPTLVNGQTVGLQLDAAGNLKVSSGATGATANQVQGTAASGTASTGNPVVVGGVYTSGALGVATTGWAQAARSDPYGNPRTAMTLQNPAGNLNGVFVGTSVGYGQDNSNGSSTQMLLGAAPFVWDGTNFRYTPGDTNGAFIVPKPVTTGGLSQARLVASAGANIKAAAGQLYGGVVTNSNAAIRYLHLYNKASAATLSTDTPVATFALPPNASVQITTDGLGAAFATGISWAFTTDNIAIPATAGATTDLHGTLFYK